MAFRPEHRALLLALLCAAGALGSSPRHGAAAGVGRIRSYVTVSTASLAESNATCSDPGRPVAPRGNATSPVLRLTHRHGPCGQTRGAPARPSFVEVLRADQRRAEYIEKRVSGDHDAPGKAGVELAGSKSVTMPAILGTSLGTLQYVVTVGLGTPVVAQTVNLDTGSDLSWVQCEPCSAPACYRQKDQLFDPARSLSYSAVPCDGDKCADMGVYWRGCSGSQCQYVVRYGDGSNTTGTYSSDTLMLTETDEVTDFLFGCGHAQTGLFAGVDGLLGLGRLDMSLVSQGSSAYGGIFSYCLPPTPSTTGYLRLGGPNSTSGFFTTKLLSAPKAPTFYIVKLTGISVGGKQLDIPAAVFSRGTVVDSGTVITRLPPRAYGALRWAFRVAMAGYGYPISPEIGILDTCYDFRAYPSVTMPIVALTFSGGATLTLEASGILHYGCLAFARRALRRQHRWVQSPSLLIDPSAD